jgi:serine/threonine protein kinase
MAEILKGTVKVVAAATGVAVLSEAFELLAALTSLVGELRGSRGMCEELVAAVQELHPQLERMLNSGKISITTAIQDYKALLEEIRNYLEIHLQRDIVTRLAKHWSVKDKIKEFHITRDRIVERMGLDFSEESADRHAFLSNTLEEVIRREERIEKQASEEFAELQRLVDASLETLRKDVKADVEAVVGSEVTTTLTDIKYQIKYNRQMSHHERELLQNTLNKVAKAVGVNAVPSLSEWYISRADIRFETSPFSTNETRSLHVGSLSSGAKVAVKVVDASENNTVKGDWFCNEVERWYRMRHPNVLTLYGACHVTTPRLLVLAHAEKGNFKEYLTKHRHFLWKLFLDAARGLEYLHSRKPPIVHANVKCANLLVMADGTGVVSDFEYAFARVHSKISAQVQASSLRWKAPECLGIGSAANARTQSDIYALGMAVYEALTGHEPFYRLSDAEVLKAVREENRLPQRPAGVISDDEWSLIKALCASRFQDRIKLEEAIRLMSIMAERERVLRNTQQCSCDRGRCSDCGRGFSTRPPPTVATVALPNTSNAALAEALQATAQQCRLLLESMQQVETRLGSEQAATPT